MKEEEQSTKQASKLKKKVTQDDKRNNCKIQKTDRFYYIKQKLLQTYKLQEQLCKVITNTHKKNLKTFIGASPVSVHQITEYIYQLRILANVKNFVDN